MSDQQTTWQRSNAGTVETEALTATFYADPLCCWSWAMSRSLRTAAKSLPFPVQLHYVMGGMIPTWESYRDPMNIVSQPLQMGPVWMHAGAVTGLTLQHNIWITDPPQSSYPACLAVKCAGLQGSDVGIYIFDLLQAALMERGLNIGKKDVIIDLVNTLEPPTFFDRDRFLADWRSTLPQQEFADDLQRCKRAAITRFPTLTVNNAGGNTYLLVGYRPAEALAQALRLVVEQTSAKKGAAR